MKSSILLVAFLAFILSFAVFARAQSDEDIEMITDRVLAELTADAEWYDDDMDSGKLSHSQAYSRISSAGIGIVSSGRCSNRNVRSCTSLDSVNSCTIDNILTLKRASGCSITITGGTETGHAGGSKSHWSGHKLDISLNSCINNYITRNFAYAGRRGDGASMYRASSGNIYAKEGNHWDITFC